MDDAGLMNDFTRDFQEEVVEPGVEFAQDPFIDYLMVEENGGQVGYDEKKQLWFPHDSPEGGNPTIAYGHKLTDEEVSAGTYDKGITMSESRRLLNSDVDKHRTEAKEMFGEEGWNELTTREQNMVTEFAFNVQPKVDKKTGKVTPGLMTFPRLFGAMAMRDTEGMERQYKRTFFDEKSGRRRGLARNKGFKKLFLDQYEGGDPIKNPPDWVKYDY